MDNIKRMADEHAKWFTRSMSRIMEGVYRDAFIHGAKHEMEYQENTDDLQDQLDAMTLERERLAADLDRQRAEGDKAWEELDKAGWEGRVGLHGLADGVKWLAGELKRAKDAHAADTPVFNALRSAGIDSEDGTTAGLVRAIGKWREGYDRMARRVVALEAENGGLLCEVAKLYARVRELEGRE